MHFQVKNTLKSNYNDTLKKKKIYSTTKAWITAYIKKKFVVCILTLNYTVRFNSDVLFSLCWIMKPATVFPLLILNL
jgi:hypothetical protein